MAKFITLHNHSNNKRLYVNVNSIAYVEDMQDGSYLSFSCSGVSGSINNISSSIETIHVKESYSQVVFKIDN